MELESVMRTTFAARSFVDEPVSDDQLYRILEMARFAPSGGNRQGWKVIVVRDAEKRAKLQELIEPVFRRYLAQVRLGESPWNTVVPIGKPTKQLTKLSRKLVEEFATIDSFDGPPVRPPSKQLS